MAAAVRFLARSSIQRPIRIKAMITRDVSKYRCSGSPARSAMPGHKVTKALYPQATPVPRATRVFMLVAPCRAAAHAAA